MAWPKLVGSWKEVIRVARSMRASRVTAVGSMETSTPVNRERERLRVEPLLRGTVAGPARLARDAVGRLVESDTRARWAAVGDR